MLQKKDAWGSSLKEGDVSFNDAEVSPFADSFSPLDAESMIPSAYIPLDDSQQYLDSLQQKLDQVAGKTISVRKKESRVLIDALVGSRESHVYNFLQEIGLGESCVERISADAHPTSTTVDPQGPLGAMLRRVAPDKVALSQEEMCRLLEEDFLGRIFEDEQERESIVADDKNNIKPINECCLSQTNNTNNEGKAIFSNQLELDHKGSMQMQDASAMMEPHPMNEQRGHSSDEGEK